MVGFTGDSLARYQRGNAELPPGLTVWWAWGESPYKGVSGYRYLREERTEQTMQGPRMGGARVIFSLPLVRAGD